MRLAHGETYPIPGPGRPLSGPHAAHPRGSDAVTPGATHRPRGWGCGRRRPCAITSHPLTSSLNLPVTLWTMYTCRNTFVCSFFWCWGSQSPALVLHAPGSVCVAASECQLLPVPKHLVSGLSCPPGRGGAGRLVAPTQLQLSEWGLHLASNSGLESQPVLE